MPEIVSTPSDIGIWEVAHMKGGFAWSKLFEKPPRTPVKGGGASDPGKQ
jgi:hypothetical protein